MTTLILPRHSQPIGAAAIDQSNPIAGSASWITHGDNPFNMGSYPNKSIRFNVSGGVTEASSFGISRKYSGNTRDYYNSYLNSGHPYLNTSGNFTLALLAICTALPSARVPAIGTIYDPGTPDEEVCQLGISINNKWEFVQKESGVLSSVEGSNVVVGKPAFVVATSAGAIYVDGVLIANANHTVRAKLRNWLLMFKGAKPDSSSGFTGHIGLEMAWPFLLSSSQIVELSSNPWQIFKPLRRTIYFDAPSGLPAIASLNVSNITSTGARLTVSA